jgi:DNA-binding MarR family transcriptional regulator
MQRSNVDESIGLLVAAARRRIKQVVWNRIRPYRMSPQQFWVILHLHQRDGMSLHELAGNIWADDPTACRIVAKLTERRLVKTDHDPEDRRRFRLTLTPRGRKLGGELSALAAEIRGGIERSLSAAEQRTLCTLLNKVIENTDRMLEPAAAAPARKRAVQR